MCGLVGAGPRRRQARRERGRERGDEGNVLVAHQLVEIGEVKEEAFGHISGRIILHKTF